MSTASTSAVAHTRSLYRRILRELPPLPTPRHKQPRTPIHSSIRSHFSQPPREGSSSSSSSSSSPPEEFALARRQEVEQFVTYLRAQRMYGTLLQRYNPGMGMDEEERVRLTARRVGMDLPVEWRKK